MTSPSVTTEAASAPVSASDKAADFENFLFGDEQDEESESGEGEVEGDDLETADDAKGEPDEQGDEPESPAIEPPVSLNAEEKAAFSQLPPEAQAAWAASETRRNTQVQEATTKASEAQRSAEVRAAAADVQAQAEYAARLEQVGRAFAPQEPNRAHYPDDASYLVDCRQHDAALAQHNEFMQQVQGMKAGAQAQAAQIDNQARAQDLLTIPELADPTTRDTYVRESLELVKAIGLDPVAFEQTASAQDFKALKQVGEWKAKAAKLDALNGKAMEKVRSAKGRNLRPNAAPHADARADRGNSWNRVQTARTSEDKYTAFADYMGL
jgi:hypothetical protein